MTNFKLVIKNINYCLTAFKIGMYTLYIRADNTTAQYDSKQVNIKKTRAKN